jgi:AraC-like DNA-binding protein
MSRLDRAEYQRSPHFPEVELLRASYWTQAFAPHFHETYAIGVVESGALSNAYRHSHQTDRYAGDVMVIPPGEVHTGRCVGNQGVSYRMIYLPVDLCEQFAAYDGPSSWHFPFLGHNHDMPGSAAVVMNVFSHLTSPETPRLQLETSLMNFLSGMQGKHTGGAEDPISHPKDPGIQQVQEFIKTNFSAGISLAQLAVIANYTPCYLVREFHRQVGLPPHAYQTWLRIRYAKWLLCQGKDPASIAVEVGFFDQSHFIKVFKRFVGIAPGKYPLSAQ